MSMFLMLCTAGIGLVLLGRAILPMQTVRLQLGVLLAADPTTLGPVLANYVIPIIAPFTNNETLVLGDLTLGSANGLIPIICSTGSAEVAIDPVSQAQIITIKPGAGTGFRWVTSGGLSVPVTVYGYALTDNAQAVLLAAQSLPQPITFTADGYQLDVDPVQMTFVLQPLF